MTYHTPNIGGSIETFYLSHNEAASSWWTRNLASPEDLGEGDSLAGWYWWACFPGCLPDGEPNGPFATEAEAIADANN